MDGISAPQIGEIIEQGKQVAANAVKTAVSDTANAVAGQVGIQNEPTGPATNLSSQIQGQVLNQAPSAEPISMQQSDLPVSESAAEAVSDNYVAPAMLNQTQQPQTQDEYNTQQRLIQIRQELHQQTYYDPLFDYEHKKEERPGEVREKEEEQKKMAELEQAKEEKKLPIAVQNAQTSTEIKGQGAG